MTEKQDGDKIWYEEVLIPNVDVSMLYRMAKNITEEKLTPDQQTELEELTRCIVAGEQWENFTFIKIEPLDGQDSQPDSTDGVTRYQVMEQIGGNTPNEAAIVSIDQTAYKSQPSS